MVKLQSDEIIGNNENISSETVRRYIRLTNLTLQLLNEVDEKKLSFISAVELSYLNKKEQDNLHDILTREENFSVPLKQASMLKSISQNGELTYEKIDKIITQKLKSHLKLLNNHIRR